MVDLGEGDADVDAFELPGDTEKIEAIQEAQALAEPAAESVYEGPPRDEKGRFAPHAEVESEPEPPEPAPDDPAPTEPDPIAAYLAKYGDDAEKAYAASVEAQSKIGEQAREL